MNTRSIKVINIIWSAVFSACIVIGYKIEDTVFSHLGIGILVLIWCIISITVYTLLAKYDKHLADHIRTSPEVQEIFPKKTFIYSFIAFIAAYIPVLLASYPGFFCYDANTETYEVFTFRYSNHHPIVHELILANSLRIGMKLFGNYNAGVTIYVVIQMIIVSAVFAFIIATLRQFGASKIRLLVSWGFLAFFPAIQMFTVCTTKDVIFSAGIVLFTTILLRSQYIKSRTAAFVMFFSACMILFFRNNGIYILPIFCVVVFTFFKRNQRLLIPVATAMILYIVTVESLIALLPAKRGETGEMLSVPMQQLARVHQLNRGSFTDSDLDILYSMIPESVLENYNPKLADDVKYNFLEDNFKSDPGLYASLWWRTFLKNPKIYAEAFLIMTDGYWCPGIPITGYEGKVINSLTYGESAYFQYDSEPPVISAPILKKLNQFYKSVSLDIRWQQTPVLGVILTPALYIWIFLFSMRNAIVHKRRMTIIYIVPLLLLMTLLLGPIALVRYALPFYMIAPIMVSIQAICSAKQTSSSQKMNSSQ